MRRPGLALLCVAALVVVVAAQDKEATFEVASVKANKSGDGNGNLRGVGSDRVVATNMPVRPMITFAYQVAGYQLIGGPGWLATDRYDINAKLEAPPTSVQPFVPGSTAPNAMQLALRNLLEDRFKLRMHRETRELDIYALVMARPGGGPGPGLNPSTRDGAAAVAAAQRPGAPPFGAPGSPFCGIAGSPGRLKFGGL